MAYRITVSIRHRLRAVIAERNAPKARFGAQIVLLSADGVGTSAIMRQTGKSKTCVGRWQQSYMEEGFDDLLRDKTRRSRIAQLVAEVVKRIFALTLVNAAIH
jgi:transposase